MFWTWATWKFCVLQMSSSVLWPSYVFFLCTEVIFLYYRYIVLPFTYRLMYLEMIDGWMWQESRTISYFLSTVLLKSLSFPFAHSGVATRKLNILMWTVCWWAFISAYWSSCLLPLWFSYNIKVNHVMLWKVFHPRTSMYMKLLSKSHTYTRQWGFSSSH
jgi:hypothetical protein